MLHDLPAARHIRGDYRPGHGRGSSRVPWSAFTIRGQHYAIRGGNRRPHVIQPPQVFDRAFIDPGLQLPLCDRAGVRRIELPQDLKPHLACRRRTRRAASMYSSMPLSFSKRAINRTRAASRAPGFQAGIGQVHS